MIDSRSIDDNEEEEPRIQDELGMTSHIVKIRLKLHRDYQYLELKAKVDTGAEVNILPRRTLDLLGLKESDLEPTTVSLVTYDKKRVRVLGSIGLYAKEPYSGRRKLSLFFVTAQENIPLISYATTKALKLLDAPNFAERRHLLAVKVYRPTPSRKKRQGRQRREKKEEDFNIFRKEYDEWKDPSEVDNTPEADRAELPGSEDQRDQTRRSHKEVDTATSVTNMDQLKSLFPHSFDTLGNLPGTYHIHVNKEIKPVQHARRIVPIEKREKIEAELEMMVKKGVITPQIEPTPWVSSLTYPMKPNGDIRICLDPKDLNKAIIRENHKAPTLTEITHKLSGAKVFSKLDAQKGFWSVHLDKPSSILTTFNTHKGCFRFLRMPFGLKMSQDVFQMKMDQLIERCPGVIAIHDDITVYGKTPEEHDFHLLCLLNTAATHGLVFNSSKCEIKQSSIAFYGKRFTQRGVEPDPVKIQGIVDMNAPKNVKELQSFLGMVNFMQPFIPHLSHHSKPLRELLKKENQFSWDQQQNSSFQTIKSLIKKAGFLSYYNRELPVIVQADASNYGLGAALIQDGKPVAFASKSLSPTEQRYANIEREMLSVVFACERFHTYLT